MERLSEIVLLNRMGLIVSVDQVLYIILLLLALWGSRRLVFKKLLPWYYRRGTTSKQNLKRIRRIVNLLALSILAVGMLRILGIDLQFFSFSPQREPTDDSSAVYITVKISTIVTVLVAFVTAGVFDVIISEVLLQRLRAAEVDNDRVLPEKDRQQLIRRFGTVRPIMYTLATIVAAETTGMANLYFRWPPDVTQELSFLITLGQVLVVILLFFVLRLVIVFTTTFVLQRYYDKSKLDTGNQFAINRLLSYFAYGIGLLLIFQAAGFNLMGIWTGAAALLVGVGIGLQQTFNDLICGVIILFERSVKVGDVVELTGHQVGTIRKIGARTSILETRDDIIIYVPNSKLIGENVTNWSQADRKARFHVTVGVAYPTDADEVRKLLLKVAAEHHRVMENPKPTVRLLDFGDNSLNFDLLFYSRDLTRVEDTKSDLRFAINSAFKSAQIEIPFPQRDIYIKSLPERVSLKEEE